MANLNRYAEMICYDSQTLKLFQATMLNLEGFAIITTWQATSICWIISAILWNIAALKLLQESIVAL